MEADYIRKILEDVKAGHRTVDDAIADLKYLPFEDLGFARWIIIGSYATVILR